MVVWAIWFYRTLSQDVYADIRTAASQKSFKLTFRSDICQTCPLYLANQCPVEFNERKSTFTLSVPKDRAISSQRRRRFELCKEEARSLRPAVEATVSQVKHALSHGKVCVRGLRRVANVIVCSTLAANLRRIHRYEHDTQRGKLTSKKTRGDSFFVFLQCMLGALFPRSQILALF